MPRQEKKKHHNSTHNRLWLTKICRGISGSLATMLQKAELAIILAAKAEGQLGRERSAVSTSRLGLKSSGFRPLCIIQERNMNSQKLQTMKMLFWPDSRCLDVNLKRLVDTADRNYSRRRKTICRNSFDEVKIRTKTECLPGSVRAARTTVL